MKLHVLAVVLVAFGGVLADSKLGTLYYSNVEVFMYIIIIDDFDFDNHISELLSDAQKINETMRCIKEEV